MVPSRTHNLQSSVDCRTPKYSLGYILWCFVQMPLPCISGAHLLTTALTWMKWCQLPSAQPCKNKRVCACVVGIPGPEGTSNAELKWELTVLTKHTQAERLDVKHRPRICLMNKAWFLHSTVFAALTNGRKWVDQIGNCTDLQEGPKNQQIRKHMLCKCLLLNKGPYLRHG